MMKKSLLLFLFAGLMLPSFAQDYPDLLELLVDEKYEKLLLKAERYTLDEDTRKDPMPYLYMSMGYRAISLKDDDPDLQEKYPKAFKESVKFAVKHRKKDKSNLYYDEYIEFFDDLRTEVMSESFGHIGSEKYTKAKGNYKNLTKLDEKDVGAWIMKGCMEHLAKSTREAQLSFETAETLMGEGASNGLTETQTDLLRDALIYCATMLDSEGSTSEARKWLELGHGLFSENEEFMVTYEMIAG